MPFADWIMKRSAANAGGIGKELAIALIKALMAPTETLWAAERDAARKARIAATRILDIFPQARVATQETPKAGAVKEVLGQPGSLASSTVTGPSSTAPPKSARAQTAQVYSVKYYLSMMILVEQLLI